MTTAADPQIVPHEPAAVPALRAADQGVASALESVLSDNTHRVYGAQWRLFTDWCGDMGLLALPAEPLPVARYLAARAGDGASIATIRLATSAIAKAHFEAPAPSRRPHRRRTRGEGDRQGRLSRVNWEFFSGHSGRVGAAVPVSYPPPQPKTA